MSAPIPNPVVASAQPIDDEENEDDDMEEVGPETSTHSPAAVDAPTPTSEPAAAPARVFSDTLMMEEDEGDDDMVEVGVEDEELFDDAAFAAALEEDMGGDGDYGDEEDDDDDMEAVMPNSAPAVPLPEDGPISLNAFAGGGMEEDDYSSSDESD